MSRFYGYISCRPGADAENQNLAFRRFGVPQDNIYTDTLGEQSDEAAPRPAYQRLISALHPGDTLVVGTIGHLGQTYGEILSRWRCITEEKHAAIAVLDLPLLNEQTNQAVTGAQLSALVLQLLSHIAETEQAFFRQRQAKGMAEARSRGVKFGRPRLERPTNYEIFYQAWKQGDISARKAAKFLGVDHHTFLRWTRAETAFS